MIHTKPSLKINCLNRDFGNRLRAATDGLMFWLIDTIDFSVFFVRGAGIIMAMTAIYIVRASDQMF